MKLKVGVMTVLEAAVLAFIVWGGKLAYDDYFRVVENSKDYVVIALLAATAIGAVLLWDSKRLHAVVTLLLQDRKRGRSFDTVVAKTLPLSLVGSSVLVVLYLIVAAKAIRYLAHVLDYMGNPFNVALNLGVILLCILIPATVMHFVARRVFRRT